MQQRFFKLILTVLVVSASVSGQEAKLQTIGSYGASEALKKVLEPNGSKITIGDELYCEVWLRLGVPAGKSDAQGAMYAIGESALVGVIRVVKATTDFRGQPVNPGAYTLRYAVHPADGNHLGISPIRDFLAMVPVAMDQNPDSQPTFEELMKMSARVAGTNHPAVLSLVQAHAAAAPKVEQESGHLVFSAKTKTQSGSDLPISFVVKGIAEQ